nr:polyprotein [Cassava torrado-like virus 2]
MVSFSKLISLPSRLSTALDSFNTLTSSFSSSAESISSVVEKTQQELIPAVERASSSFGGICDRIMGILDKFTAFFRPILSAVSMIQSLWDSVRSSFVSMMKDKYSSLHLLVTKLIVCPEDNWEIICSILLACVCLLSFFWSIPRVLFDSLCSSLSVCFRLAVGFLETLLPTSWIPEWLTSFTSASECISHAVMPEEGTDVSFSSNSISTLFLFGLTTFIYCSSNMKKVKKPAGANFITECLWSSGDFAQKCNNLFSLFRNMQNHLGSLLGKILDFMYDCLGMQNPTLVSINQLLTSDLFSWMQRVEKACDPEDRLVRYATAEFGAELCELRKIGAEIKSACSLRPPVPFLSCRLQTVCRQLEKTWEDYCAHRGVGQARTEPFMMQWFGAPGVGKTMMLNYFITDLFKLMGESEVNQVYSVPIKDQYWSGYAHQTGVLFDDLGALVDASGQCEDVKQIISLKSSQPVALSMAALEEKGTHFDSKYIFCTSNEKNPPKSCGLVTPEAFARRRDLLVEVVRQGPIDFENPAVGASFNVYDSKAPNNRTPGLQGLSYVALLNYVHAECKRFFTKGQVLNNIQSLAEKNMETHAKVVKESEFLIESCKMGYYGSLGQLFPLHVAFQTRFDSMKEEDREATTRWCRSWIEKPLAPNQLFEIHQRVPEVYRNHFMTFGRYARFEEGKFLQWQGTNHMLHECLVFEDEDFDELFQTWPVEVKYLYALIVRARGNFEREFIAQPEAFSTWCLKMVEKALNAYRGLPFWVRLAVRMLATYYIVSAVSSIMSGVMQLPATLCSLIKGTIPEAITHVQNSSGDFKTSRGKKSVNKFLKPQFSQPEAWSVVAQRDPFLRDFLPNNLVAIRTSSGCYFRGLLIDGDWMMTVAHGFRLLNSGTKIDVIFQHSVSHFLLDKRKGQYLELEGRDICFINIAGLDGPKKSLRKHFASKNGFVSYPGSDGLLVTPLLDHGQKGSFLDNRSLPVTCEDGTVGPLTYSGDDGFKYSTKTAMRIRYASVAGDCGSVLMLPNVAEKQPVIAGIICAGYNQEYREKGILGSFVTLVYKEDLNPLSEPDVLQAHGPNTIIKACNRQTNVVFDDMQVYYMGRVPREMAAEVPRKSTLSPSPIFSLAEEVIGPHQTEPSILIKGDERAKEFDPYIAGIQKFNETAQCFDMVLAREVFEDMKDRLLFQMKKVPCPGGVQVRSELEALNGIPCEEYYDPMDLNTSCGYPLNTLGLGKSKRNFVTGDPGEVLLDRSTPVGEMYEELHAAILKGEVSQLVTTECAKDERLPLRKIHDEPKTRLFTILPFHYNVLVRQYFLDFSATMMRCKMNIASKVGIDAHGPQWTELALQFLNVSSEGFSADYSAFDGRAPYFIFQWFCELVSEFYGDSHMKPRKALLAMASDHYTLCGQHLYRVLGGMPSGFSLTVIYNSLLNEFYMRYAFGAMLKRPELFSFTQGLTLNDFSRIFLAVYGDDNLVAVPFDLKWYTLPRIAHELKQVNVIIKNGCDKTADVHQSKTMELSELVFLSRAFVKTRDGFYKAPLKWVSVTERLFWIRTSAFESPIEALNENITSALLEAHQHGEVVYEGFRRQILDILQRKQLPFPCIDSYTACEIRWLSKVTGDKLVLPLDEGTCEELEPREKICNAAWNRECVECFPSVYCASSRTFLANGLSKDYIVVNCTSVARKGCIQGPINAEALAQRVWAFTLQAIYSTQVEWAANNRVCKGIVFVSQAGVGISVICAGLFALAQARYSASSVLHRVESLLGAKLNKYAAGTGSYLIKAAYGDLVPQSFSPCFHIRGTNMMDRMFSVGIFDIVIGVNELLKIQISAPYWVGPRSCCAPVRLTTNSTYEDPDSTQLLSVRDAAVEAGYRVLLFFSSFTFDHAKWLYKALDLSEQALLTMSDLFNVIDSSLSFPFASMVPYGKSLKKGRVVDEVVSEYFTEDEVASLTYPLAWWKQAMKKQSKQFRTQRSITMAMLSCLDLKVKPGLGDEVAARVVEVFEKNYGICNEIATLAIVLKLDEQHTLTIREVGSPAFIIPVLSSLGITICEGGFDMNYYTTTEMVVFELRNCFSKGKLLVSSSANLHLVLCAIFALQFKNFKGSKNASMRSLFIADTDPFFTQLLSNLNAYVHSQEVCFESKQFLVTTTNKNKAREYEETNKDLQLSFRKIETVEIQGTVQEIALDKYNKILCGTNENFVTEDVSLEIEGCSLGPYVKYFKEQDFQGFLGRKATFVLVQIVHYEGQGRKQSKTLEGLIVAPRGNNGFGFDRVFEYNGMTLAEMSDEEKWALDLRKISAHLDGELL